MSDTSDLAPPQRAPVLRTNPSGRSGGDAAEQSLWGAAGGPVTWTGMPFEDGAEQSYTTGGILVAPFEDGAEQSLVGHPGITPFEDGAEH